jgi:hypothetical protein
MSILTWERHRHGRFEPWYIARLEDGRKAVLRREHVQWGERGRRKRSQQYRITIYRADGTW